MKLGPKAWCKIQETLANIKCPSCFSTKYKLNENEEENATCEECGCKFKVAPDIDKTWID